jgi:EAL and modified HD-GYP domain-containing signal transduction protein
MDMVVEAACGTGHDLPVERTNKGRSRFIARQPILNVQREAVGYELLFREGWENRFTGERDAAVRQTLDNCVSMDIEALVGNGLAFLNCTREALVGRLVTLMPPATTVLEILETVEPDAEVVTACTELRTMGYRIALDDFQPRAGMAALVRLASYVKVDFQATDLAERQEIQGMVRGTGTLLVAEKVEDQEEFSRALGEGYSLFQGYFFCRPKIIAGREIPPNRMNYLRLLVELTRPSLNVDAVIGIVRMEPSLFYRLLRLANSPLWGVRKEVTSVGDALMLVGEERFRMLVSVAGSTMLGAGQPTPLISLALERARFCELVAPLIGENPTEQFILGLLSLLDAMTETPMETMAKSLPLRAQAKEALLGAANHVSVPLRTIQSFESGMWSGCPLDGEVLGIGESLLTRLYVESVKWATDSIAACT